jgi:DNA (cytosine-5)-methyltransferase 1
MSNPTNSFYEFFAGGGMARAGLGPSWACLFANDIDEKKAASYVRNWGVEGLKIVGVEELTPADLPNIADLAWASFPCQDLSLAGSGAGLNGARSGTFWPFWELMKGLGRERRAPTLIVLENVCGALTSHGGQDFVAIASALAEEKYSFGALVLDAVYFLPQSRPRLFIIAIKEGTRVPDALVRETPEPAWTTAALVEACQKLPQEQQKHWIWWNLPRPAERLTALSDLIEEEPSGVNWHTPAETERLLQLMNPLNLEKVEEAKRAGARRIGTVYKRTRLDGAGKRVQRAEIRFDGIAGCLRTPIGGSSRQIVMIVEGARVRSRLLSPRETARLMGLPEGYKLPENYNEAYHLTGDGLAVPVVRHLAAHVLEPTLAAGHAEEKEAA